MRGTVQDGAGAKLSGVTVSASTTPVITAETDSKGAFSLQITHSGSLTFTLTMEKGCWAAPPKRVTLTNNTPYDTGITTLTLKPEPTAEGDRYTLTRKSDGSWKLTVKECVTTIPQGEFSAFESPSDGITKSPILQRLANASGKAIGSVLTEIELPSTLTSIGKYAFMSNAKVTGNLSIPKNVTAIGDYAFHSLGSTYFVSASAGGIGASLAQAPTIIFAPGSRLTTIGREAFSLSGSKDAPLVLPDRLETIEIDAFRRFVMPSTDLVIPASVRKIGNGAFRSAYDIRSVTIRSTNLTKDAAAPRLGTNLFGRTSDTTRESTITTIKLPRAVYESYLNTSGTPRSELDAIFGSEVTDYQDLNGNTL